MALDPKITQEDILRKQDILSRDNINSQLDLQKVDINVIKDNIPSDFKPKGANQFTLTILDKSDDLKEIILPKILDLGKQLGIEGLNTANPTYPNKCPNPELINKILNIRNNIVNQFSPNIGAGVYFHSDKLYAGFSVPQILETKYFDSGQTTNGASSVAASKRHYHFIAGHVLDLLPSLQFKPAMLIKEVEGSPLQMDVSANFLYNEKLTIGAAYRLNSAISFLTGFQINPNWFIGYGYDLEQTKLTNNNFGSHEFFLRYEFARKNKVLTPRFF